MGSAQHDMPTMPATCEVELTADGYVRFHADLAKQLFPTDSLVALLEQRELWLYPIVGPESGGLLMKQRNARGDRSVLVHEVLPTRWVAGTRLARWDNAAGALRVALTTPENPDQAERPQT